MPGFRMTVAIEDENPQHNNCTFGRWREVNKVTKEDKKGWAIDSDRISVEESARLIAQLVSSPDFRDKEGQKLIELRHQVLG